MESVNNSSNNDNNTNENKENKHGKTKFEELISLKDPQILENWRKEQDELKSKLIKTDFKNWNLNNDPNNKANYEELKYIGYRGSGYICK